MAKSYCCFQALRSPRTIPEIHVGTRRVRQHVQNCHASRIPPRPLEDRRSQRPEVCVLSGSVRLGLSVACSGLVFCQGLGGLCRQPAVVLLPLSCSFFVGRGVAELCLSADAPRKRAQGKLQVVQHRAREAALDKDAGTSLSLSLCIAIGIEGRSKAFFWSGFCRRRWVKQHSQSDDPMLQVAF